MEMTVGVERQMSLRLRVSGLLLLAICAWPIWQLLQFSLGSEMYSHILLVPFVTAYLIWLLRDQPAGEPTRGSMATVLGGVLLALGMACLAAYYFVQQGVPPMPNRLPAFPKAGSSPEAERSYGVALGNYSRGMRPHLPFKQGDIRDLNLLARVLAGSPGRDAAWMRGLLSPATRSALPLYLDGGIAPEKMERALIIDLNRALHGNSVHDREVVKEATTNESLRAFLSLKPGGQVQVLINRRTIETVLPHADIKILTCREDYLARVQDTLFVGILGAVLIAIGWIVCWKGAEWARARLFPLAFLLFCVPLPMVAEHGMAVFFQHTSAWTMRVLSGLTGVHLFGGPDMLSYQLIPPDYWMGAVPIRVAEECSGIRSTWVLFMTSLLAGYLFLRSPRRRWALLLLVVPLGIVRNAVRITVLNLLVEHSGRHWLDSWVHTQGGPLFFALSLIPFFLFLVWLRRQEAHE